MDWELFVEFLFATAKSVMWTYTDVFSAGDLYQQEYVPVIEELMSDDSAKVREALVTNIKPVVALIGQQMFVSTFQVSSLNSQIFLQKNHSLDPLLHSH